MADYAAELSFALEIADAGGRLALGHFGKDPQRQQKTDGTWVTEADWAVEAQIRIRIARSFPDHNILGEEEGLTAAGGGEPNPDAPTWIVDPIDGTHNYMMGIPIWATLVALQVEGHNVVGVAHAPALHETYDAALGQGARMNGSAIRVSPLSDLSQASFMHAGTSRFQETGMADLLSDIASRVWRDRGIGDFWGHMLVARGAAHIMAEPELSVWDVAALEPIITEAGGRITHLDGTVWAEAGSALTTCGGPLHDEVVAVAGQIS